MKEEQTMTEWTDMVVEKTKEEILELSNHIELPAKNLTTGNVSHNKVMLEVYIRDISTWIKHNCD